MSTAATEYASSWPSGGAGVSYNCQVSVVRVRGHRQRDVVVRLRRPRRQLLANRSTKGPGDVVKYPAAWLFLFAYDAGRIPNVGRISNRRATLLNSLTVSSPVSRG